MHQVVSMVMRELDTQCQFTDSCTAILKSG